MIQPPPTQDSGVVSISFDENGNWPAYHHPASGQILDDVFAIPLEGPINGGSPGGVIFVDVQNPKNPIVINKIDLPVDGGVLV